MNNLVMGFPYVHIEVELNCLVGGRLPQHKTSMLRGVLARIIRNNVCHDFKLPCASCEFATTCIYPSIFDSTVKRTSSDGAAGRNYFLPNPYIIRCGNEKEDFEPEERLTFEMIFMGYEADIYANVMMNALRDFHNMPLGPNQAQFKASKVAQMFQRESRRNSILNNGNTPAAFETQRFPMIELQYFTPGTIDDDRIMIHFKTPLKMQKDSQILRRFSFDHFMWQVNHRVAQTALIMKKETDEEQGILQEDLHFPDEAYTVIRDEWKEYFRYSSRQLKPIKLSGILATVEIQTALIKEWLPLLEFAEMFHVGKATTFGLGQLELWTKRA